MRDGCRAFVAGGRPLPEPGDDCPDARPHSGASCLGPSPLATSRKPSQARAMSETVASKPNRRWLLGVEPFFEGGWLHKGTRSRSWDVEEGLGAVALLGDVTIDLTNARTIPHEIEVRAYAIGRDVDVLVTPGTRVELSGRANNDHLDNDAADVPWVEGGRVVKITGHTFLGDVTVRTVDTKP